jgi:hypothetical protein
MSSIVFHSYRFPFKRILNWHDVIGMNMRVNRNFSKVFAEKPQITHEKTWDVKDDTLPISVPLLNLIPSNSVLISFSRCDFDVYICRRKEDDTTMMDCFFDILKLRYTFHLWTWSENEIFLNFQVKNQNILNFHLRLEQMTNVSSYVAHHNRFEHVTFAYRKLLIMMHK